MIFLFNEIEKNDSSISLPYTVRLEPAVYFIECWGAQGGTGSSDTSPNKYYGGKGAYASGVLTLKEPQTFYLYIGGKGGDGSQQNGTRAKAGWNGGGEGGEDQSDDDGSGAGGGSTDIRYQQDDLSSRIIVAAGGSGSVKGAYGAPGGGIHGLIPIENYKYNFTESDTNQEDGHSPLNGTRGGSAKFVPPSGGGGGYQGGNGVNVSSCSLQENNYYKCVASSGSSYVSGHKDCAINSMYVFQRSQIISGLNKMPHYSLDEVEGNEGNGAIRISILKTYCYSQSFHEFSIYSSFYFFIVSLVSISI